jgi:hypothetical protein
MWSPLPDEIGCKEKEQDATHNGGRSNLKGSPVTNIRVITSLNAIQY